MWAGGVVCTGIMLNLPSVDCTLCPRLAAFHAQNRDTYPTYHNAPVPSFGSANARRLIVGLAPGLHGANQTARPFTGDYAGDTLYDALVKHGLAKGKYAKHADDGLELLDVRITNAVRCVPPENKPITSEIAECNPFLGNEIRGMPNLKAVLILGGISHKAALKAMGYKQSHTAFTHGGESALDNGITLLSSYHCSRYNVNTGRLTVDMFDAIIKRFAEL